MGSGDCPDCVWGCWLGVVGLLYFVTYVGIPGPYKLLTQFTYQNDLQGLLFNLIMIICSHVTVSCSGS